MDVTRRNFYDLLPDIKEALSSAAFVSIDGEFTGLSNGVKELGMMPFDTPQQFYEKMHQRSLDFLMLQFGVCMFHHNEGRYTHQAFNFYLFPPTDIRGAPDLVFQCQSSSLAFLAKNSFDFNKTIGEGIPYLTQIAEDQLRTTIQERQNKLDSNVSSREFADIPIPSEKKNILENNLKLIKAFADDTSENRKDELVINHCTFLIRRLLYQEVRKKFGDSIYLETKDDFHMLVMRGSDGLREKRLEERKKREWKDFDDAVGFSQFVKLLSASGKLIVGHNFILDLFHLVNRFRYPLPDDYQDFKEMIHHIFPRVIDTKYMAIAEEFEDIVPSTALNRLVQTFSEHPFKMPSVKGKVENQSYSILNDKSHEAGYDAYVTGLCFLSMCQYLSKGQGKKIRSIEEMSDILKRFENRLYLLRVQDVPYMQLGGPDRKPPRNHVFHLCFPREWNHHEITELFKPFGPVSIFFINERSAFVALQRRNQASIVLKTMSESSTYKVTPFSSFIKSRSSFATASVRKRKVLDTMDCPQSSGIPKKLCNVEQPTLCSERSINPTPPEAEGDSDALADPSRMKIKEETDIVAKEFPETDDW